MKEVMAKMTTATWGRALFLVSTVPLGWALAEVAHGGLFAARKPSSASSIHGSA